jgi:single-strand DNA-binding protein
MPNLNVVVLAGHLGRDAETKHVGNGASVTNFSLATTKRFKDGGEWKDKPVWHRVVAWRLPQDVTAQLVKGVGVKVTGELESRTYDDKDGKKVTVVEVVADSIKVYEREAKQPVSMPRSAKPAEPPHAYAQPQGGAISDDDVPFMRYEVPCL